MKKSTEIFIILFLFFLTGNLSAQNYKCFSEEYVHSLDASCPGFQNYVHRNHVHTAACIPAIDPGEVFNIQVVVHVVYNKDEENIPDSLIHSQIKVLNDCFRRQNADTVNTLAIFKPVAADAGIQFSLATKDPEGNPTSGITRTKTYRSTFFVPSSLDSIDNVKANATGGKDAWPTREYLNIWICKLDFSFYYLMGYSYPPVGSVEWDESSIAPDPQKDGVVIAFQSFGENNPYAIGDNYEPYNLGKTAVHETGHYLGLQHIWGPGTPSCSSDDGFSDTPNTDVKSNGGCDTTRYACRDSILGVPDMVQNYMDYSCDACANIFTRDQGSLMRQILRTTRAGLNHAYNANNSLKDMTSVIQVKPSWLGRWYVVKNTSKKVNVNSLTLYSEFGNIVKHLPLSENKKSRLVHLGKLKPGTYWAKMKVQDSSITQKIAIK